MFDVALANRTPFEAATHVQMDGAGQELLVVVMSASFMVGDDGLLALASRQEPVCFADEACGEPGRSSMRLESDIAALKPRVDVVVTGAAMAPGGRPASELLVGLRVADIHKTLRVTGDRELSAWGSGRPQAFTHMPLVYERAFGGTTASGDVCVTNPVGIGYRRAASSDPEVRSRVANIEWPDKRAHARDDERRPAGFGIVARHWAPRIALAGTYDQAWLDEVWPLPPADFNPLFNQIAPADQQTVALAGGELVELAHMTPSGLWKFRLPRLDVPARLLFDDRVESRETRIDTVLIDASRQVVTLKSRLAIRRMRNTPRLREVVLGHVSPAWLSARQKRKTYRDPLGHEGRLAGHAAYVL